MSIYTAIKDDHELQRELCQKLLDTSGGGEERRELWQELKKELQVHEVAEERHFYAPLIDTDKMQEDARHGMAEHHEIDDLIRDLEDTEMDSSQWLVTFKKLVHQVEHHLEDEEKEFFEKAKKVYSSEEAEKLAQAYKRTRDDYRAGWPDSIPDLGEKEEE
jgi:hypothetical protein